MKAPVEDIGAPEEKEGPTTDASTLRGEGGRRQRFMQGIRHWIQWARQRQRSLVVGSTIILVLSGASAAVSAVGSVVFARLLGPHEFGVLVLYSTGVATLSLFADVLGFRFANAYTLASARSAVPLPQVRGTALFYGLVTGFAVGGLVIFSPVWAIIFPPFADPAWKLLVLFGLLGHGLLAQIQAIYQGLRGFLSLGSLTLFQATVYLSLGAMAGLGLGLRSAQGMALMQAVSLLLTALLYIARFRRQGLARPSLSYLRQEAGVGARAATVNWLSFLHTRVDQYLITRLLGPAALGVYGVAVSAGDFLTRVPAMVARVLSPTVAASPDEIKSADSTLRLVLASMGLTAAVSLPLAIFAPQIIGLLYGQDFVESAEVLRLYLPAVVSLSGILLANAFMVGTGYPPFMLATLGIVLAVNVGLNALVLPRWGVQAAALTSTLTYGLQILILLAYLAKARRGIRTPSHGAAPDRAGQSAADPSLERWTAGEPSPKLRPRASHWMPLGARVLAGGNLVLEWLSWLLARVGIHSPVPKRIPAQHVRLRDGQSSGAALRKALGERLLSPETEAKPLADALESLEPGITRRILAEADAACAHDFDLLGSGPVHLGDPIDWHAGLKSGYRWDPRAFYRHIRPAAFPGGPDIKEPWELSRCHHFVRLGQAYRLTGDEKYALELVAQLESWMEANLWPNGVNWASPMDAAIRAANWLSGVSLCVNSAALSDEFLQRLALNLWIHGRHIRRHLEGSRDDPYTGNHYLANLAGLIYLGLFCPFLRDAQEWLEFAVGEFYRELLKQTYPDGADDEGSVYYHRFVLEMALYVTALCRKEGVHLPPSALARLGSMLDFLKALTRADGTFPLFGDHDNGRFHRLSVWGDPAREWMDAREHLALGAALFERRDLAESAGSRWQEAVWLFGPDCLRMREAVLAVPRPAGPCSFPSAGVYVIRDSSSHMVIDAGPGGRHGRGGHAHGDTLAFELFALGRTWILDPGCYVYTADYSARNLLRSAAAHNTVIVDGLEIHPFEAKRLFSMPDTGHVSVLSWSAEASEVVLDLEQAAFGRLTPPVLHRRGYLHRPDSLTWLVQDVVETESRRRASLCLTFSPELRVRVSGLTVTAEDPASAAQFVAAFEVDGSADVALEPKRGWVSRSYGSRVEAACLVVAWDASGSTRLKATYRIIPTSARVEPQGGNGPAQ